MSSNLPRLPIAGNDNVSAEDSAWWDQNREAVETKFIGMLMAETSRKPYDGPERRSRGTVVLDPADMALARQQAKELGITYEEHVSRLFHQAVLAQAKKLSL